MYTFIALNDLIVNEQFLGLLKMSSLADIHSLMSLESGNLFKRNRFRSVTMIDIKTDDGSRTFYLKRHFWPLRERIKAIIPLLKKEDAGNEWKSICLLNKLGFETMVPVAFGEKKQFGVPSLSLTLTEGIQGAEKLEEYLPRKFSPPLVNTKLHEKRNLIKQLATFARDFHSHGLNHQDFYLGHLFYRESDRAIIVVDIQRVHRKKIIAVHARIKDLAQLAFSAKGLGIFTRADFMRFACAYFDTHKLARGDKKLVRRILAKVVKIERHTVKLLERRRRKV